MDNKVEEEKLAKWLSRFIRLGALLYIATYVIEVAPYFTMEAFLRIPLETLWDVRWEFAKAFTVPIGLVIFGARAGQFLARLILDRSLLTVKRCGQVCGCLIFLASLLFFSFIIQIAINEIDYYNPPLNSSFFWTLALLTVVAPLCLMLALMFYSFRIGGAIASLAFSIAKGISVTTSAVRDLPASSKTFVTRERDNIDAKGGKQRLIGIVLIVVGISWMVVALNTDTTIMSGYSRIHNIGMMDERRNHLFVAATVLIVGFLLLLMGGSGRTSTSRDRKDTVGHHSSPIPGYAGERQLDSDRYRLYLVHKYGVHENQTLHKFVSNNQSFESLELALEYAHLQDIASHTS